MSKKSDHQEATASLRVLDVAAGHALAYMQGIGVRSVFPGAEPIRRLRRAVDVDLPDSPTDSGDILRFLDEYVAPATVASTGGRYFGFVTGGAMPVTIASHWLATAWDQNCFSHVSSPAMAIMEESALRWLLQLLELPENCEGTFVTGGTMANLTCLAAARSAVLGEYGWDVERKGLSGAPAVRVVVGGQAHASIYKTLGLLGLGREGWYRCPLTPRAGCVRNGWKLQRGRQSSACRPEMSTREPSTRPTGSYRR